jgi:hypothetical protein
MTDRYCGFAVTLASDLREDDAESTINAIRHIKGVLAVTPVLPDISVSKMIMTIQINKEIRDKLYSIIRELD